MVLQKQILSLVLRPWIISLVVVCLSVLRLSCGTASGSQEDHSPKSISATCGFNRGQVFLISSMSPGGELGWLLCFDASSKASWLYRPPSMIELHMEQNQSSGSMKLKTEGLPDGSYLLEVTVAGHEMHGSLTIRSGSNSSESTKHLVSGHRLNAPEAGRTVFRDGRYSNAKYMEETGDATGMELILFLAEGQRAGLIKFNESYWGEPEFVPLFLSNIRVMSGRKLGFELKLEGGVTGKYLAIRKGEVIILRRTDVPSAPDAEPVKLQRQSHLLP